MPVRELRTFVDENGDEYEMPVDVDPDYWVAMDRLFSLGEGES